MKTKIIIAVNKLTKLYRHAALFCIIELLSVVAFRCATGQLVF